MTKSRRRVVGILRAFLMASGWRQIDLARASGINKALVSQYFSGKRDLTARSALKMEQATKAAREAGATKADPLLVSEILPDLSTEPVRGSA